MSVGILISYHLWKKKPLDRLLAGPRPLVFADSGAYSASTVGAVIDIDAYAAWLRKYDDYLDIACTLDVVGDAEATLANTNTLIAAGCDVIPVFHVGEPFDALRHFCERFPFVCLGGMVPWSSQPDKVLRWLVACFQVARPYGTVFHGLGQTAVTTLSALPFYSVDSSSWTIAERYGWLTLWDDNDGWTTIRPARDPHRAYEAAAVLRAHGLEPSMVTDPTYARPVEGKDVQTTYAEVFHLRETNLGAWVRMTEWWAKRHGPVVAPELPAGPHLFAVCAIDDQLTSALRILAPKE